MDSLRRHDEYDQGPLDPAELDADPLAQFAAWLSEAEAAGVADPNAMVLSTVGEHGPTSRTVLLKGVLDGRFEFVTNAHSRKGRSLAEDPRVSLAFPWYPLHRQVLIDGVAAQAPNEVSDAYWTTRPRGSQIGAWASEQSAPIASRSLLEQRVRESEARFAGIAAVPRPPHWGAWLVTPHRVEFWQGRRSRLHDRLVYARTEDGWALGRLQP